LIGFKLFCESLKPSSEVDDINPLSRNHHFTHHYDIGGHQLRISFSDMRHHQAGAYGVEFQINGRWNRRGRISGENQYKILHAVKHSTKTFVDKHKPTSLHFDGFTPDQHKVYQHIGPVLAKQLGGKFTAGIWDHDDHHTVKHLHSINFK
jgi:hypothetical protein